MFRELLGACVGFAMMAMAATLSPPAAQAALTKTYDYTENTFSAATFPFGGSSITGSFTIDCGLAGGGVGLRSGDV